MVLVVRIDEVLQDGAGLKHIDLLAVREGAVGDGGHAAVRIDGEEPRLLLHARSEIDFLDGVRETQLFERDRNFDPVRGLRGVQGDWGSSHGVRSAKGSSSGDDGGNGICGSEEVFRKMEESAVHDSGGGRGVLYQGHRPRNSTRGVNPGISPKS